MKDLEIWRLHRTRKMNTINNDEADKAMASSSSSQRGDENPGRCGLHLGWTKEERTEEVMELVTLTLGLWDFCFYDNDLIFLCSGWPDQWYGDYALSWTEGMGTG